MIEMLVLLGIATLVGGLSNRTPKEPPPDDFPAVRSDQIEVLSRKLEELHRKAQDDLRRIR